MSLKRVKREYLIAALVTAVYAAVVFRIIGSRYLINDDYIIRDILSGRFSGVPDAHIYNVIYPFAWLLMQLYILVPRVDWWALMMVTAPLLGLFLVQARVLQRIPRYPLLAVFLVLTGFTCCGLYSVVMFSFTFSGTLAGAAALFLFITGEHKGNPFKEYFFSFLLLLFAFCVRKDTFLMVMPFIGVYSLLLLLRSRSREQEPGRLLLRFTLLAAVLGIAVFSCFFLHKLAFSEPQWQHFLEFRDLRKAVHDYTGYPDYDEHTAFYEDLGLAREEYNCVGTTGTGGVNTVLDFSSDIRDILRAVGEYGNVLRNSRSLGTRLLNAAEKIGKVLIYNPLYDANTLMAVGTLLALCVIFCFRLLRQRRYADTLLLTAGFFVLAAELFYLGWKGRLNVIVFYCELWLTAICLGAVLLALHDPEEALFQPKWFRRVGIPCLLMICSALFWLGLIRELVWIRNGDTASTAVVRDYCAQREENIYFEPAISISSHIYPLEVGNFDSSFNNLMTLGGWNATSPQYEQVLKTFGLQEGYTIEQAILLQDNVYVVSGEQYVLYIQEYFSWKYGDSVSWKIVDTLDAFDGVNVYDFDLQS